MSRVRSAAQRAPQTLEAAANVAERLAACSADIDKLEVRRGASLARINAGFDFKVIPLLAELKDLAKQLQPWWAANEAELTEGKRKSIELGGCLLGYRMTPPKVVFEHGKDEDAAEALLFFGHDALVRVKPAPDKPAILGRLNGDLVEDLVPLELLGFEARQTEEFFVDRITAGAGATIAR